MSESQPPASPSPAFEARIAACAGVIVRIGLNLQPRQRLLIAEPYELHGVTPEAKPLVDAVIAAAGAVTGDHPNGVEVIRGDQRRLRGFIADRNWRGLSLLAADNARRMNDYVARGDALLFLLGSHPTLTTDLPPDRVAEARRIGNEYFGEISRQLTQGLTNWTAAPAPSRDWADAAYPDFPPDSRMAALWAAVFEALRINSRGSESDALAAWDTHLRKLQKHRDELNARRLGGIRFCDDGTDLSVTLPAEHVWCTACMRSKAGVPFVANLPTEEIFTLPHKDSAQGILTAGRPVVFGGTIIDGITLEFQNGRVVNAAARHGGVLLRQLLETDEGAARLGEVAILAGESAAGKSPDPPWSKGRLFHHVLLDENAGNHVALGEGYAFCLKSPNPGALNRSLIHVDVPVAAKANLLA